MMSFRTLVVTICSIGLTSLALAQGAAKAAPPRVAPAEAKNHIGEAATVCGTVVDSKVADPGVGRGKPVFFDLDEPQPKPVFFFVAFGTPEGGPQEAIAAYQGKQVCVTGKISSLANGPFIMAADRTQVKVQKAQAQAK